MPQVTSPIRGKVARVLNSRELALNIGAKDGVHIDMKFDVLDPKGEDIIDPDTEEVLGSLERPKVRVIIVRAQERLSVARTYKQKLVNVGGTGPALGVFDFGRSLLPPKYVKRYETLKTRESTWEDLDEEESFVKPGDPVVQVLEEDDQ